MAFKRKKVKGLSLTGMEQADEARCAICALLRSLGEKIDGAERWSRDVEWKLLALTVGYLL